MHRVQPPAAVRHPGIALAVILACHLMVTLDATVVNIAMPSMKESLGFSPTGLSWVFSAYTLAFGGLLLLGGRAGDLFGRRRMFVGGVALFTFASLLGGLATSSTWLLVARAVQGAGGAMASPNVLALIATNFADGPRRNRALSLFSATASGSFALGLILGGMLTSWASWRWVFFINIPVGIVVLLLAPRFIEETVRSPGRVDLAGALSATGGVAALVYALTRSSSAGWSDPTTLAALGAAAVLLAVFAAMQRRSSQPMVPLRLLVERNRVGAYLNMLLLPAAMFGVFFFVTQFLQVVLGLTPLQAGLGFLPMALGMFGLVRIVPRLLPRFGARRLMALGIGLMTVAMAWLAQIGPHSGYVAGLLGPLLLIGVGMGLAIVPVSVTVLTGVRAQDSGAASGLLQTMQWVGGTLGLAILVSAFGVATRGAAGQSPDAGALALPRDVMVAGMDGAFLVAACFTTAALGVALMVLRPESAIRAYERGSPVLTEPSL